MGIQFLNGVPYGTTRQIRELTQAEYDALPDSKNNDGIMYFIKNSGVASGIKMFALTDIYDTNEREIGVWIDGKPLYQKTWDFSSSPIALSYGTWTQLLLDNIQIDTVIGYRAIRNKYTDMTGSTEFTADYNGTVGAFALKLWENEERNLTYFVMQYTKTIDAPGSGSLTPQGTPTHHYSTDEHVIGTWIDGKPIYEITFDFYDDIDWNISYSVWNGTGKYIQNCGRILKATCSSNAGVYTEVMAYSDSDHIKVQTPRNGDTTQCRYLTIQYTKTTD